MDSCQLVIMPTKMATPNKEELKKQYNNKNNTDKSAPEI